MVDTTPLSFMFCPRLERVTRYITMHETAAANAESAIPANENRTAKTCTVLIIVASQYKLRS
jgi:hypothetical protein